MTLHKYWAIEFSLSLGYTVPPWPVFLLHIDVLSVCVHVCMHACVRVLALRACMTRAHMFLLACAAKRILGLHWLSQEQYKEMEVALQGRNGSSTDRQWKG